MRQRPKPAAWSSAARTSGSGNRPRSISTRDGKSGASHILSKYSGRNVAMTTLPPGPRTRSSSGTARLRSTRCTTSQSTARSNQPSRNGSASALPRLNPALCGALACACSSISPEESIPHTLAPRSARSADRRPVPQPTSRTRLPRMSPSAQIASATSSQFASAGRSRSYRSASRPKSGVVAAASPPAPVRSPPRPRRPSQQSLLPALHLSEDAGPRVLRSARR